MSSTPTSTEYEIIWLVRRLFRALARKGTDNLEGTGITVADRAVMEFLYPDRKLSVPEIARRYDVSRQHVQVTVNALLEQDLAVTRDNPRHRRSPLVMLSPAGRRLFRSVLKKDQKTVVQLFSDVTRKDIETSRKTLQTLLNALEGE